MKKLIISTLIGLTIASTHINVFPMDTNESWIHRAFEQLLLKLSKKTTYVNDEDLEACSRIMEQEVEFLLQPGLQQEHLKKEINEFKEKSRKSNIDELHKRTFLTKKKAKRLSIELARGSVMDYLEQKAANIALAKLQRSPVNPELIDKQQLIRKIKNEVQNNSLACLANNHRLVGILHSLDALVQSSLDACFKQLGYVPSNTSAKPVFSNDSGVVLEIYPTLNSKLRETFFSKSVTEKRERLRDEEKNCPVCFESFKEDIKARVNLYCGHFICPSCAHTWFYKQKKLSCPLCRQSVNRHHFSEKTLKKHAKP